MLSGLWNDMEDELQEAVALGVHAIEGVKKFLDDPAINSITALIPGTWDDAAVAWLRKILPELLKEADMVNEVIEDVDTALAAAATKFGAYSERKQKLALHDLSVLIGIERSKETAEIEMTVGQAIAMNEYYYRNELNKSAA
jgi:hypothetical protein